MAKDQSRKQVLDKLGEYAAAGSFDSDPAKLLKLHKEEGDRGLVIILASQLEDILLDRICEDLNAGDENRRALTKGGPLRSFEQRIVMAKAMGILTQTDADVFDVFRHMRNACAHSRKDISFKTPQLLEALLLLTPGAEHRLRGDRPAVDPAAALIMIAGWMINFLAGESHQQTHARFTSLIAAHVGEDGKLDPDKLRASLQKKRNNKQAPGPHQDSNDKGR